MAPKPSAPTAAPKSGAFERVRLEPLPEHMCEEITAEQLVIDVAALSDLTEDEVRQTGVQSNLVALHLCGNVPEHRQDLLRLAQGLTIIRPTADPPVANASATGPAAIDDALGINVSTGTVGSASAKAGMPASANAGMLPGSNGAPAPNATVPNEPVPAAPVPSEPNGALNAVPWEARNLMNEPMVPHRLSRHGPVTVEVSAALTAMDCGVELTRVWNELDAYVAAVVENDRERVFERANDLADRMLRAQVGLAETLYKREWNEDTAPMLSVLLPGTRSGGTTACRFDHPDQHSNGPMSSLRMRMHSLGIQTEINGPNDWTIETSWTQMTKAERVFLTKGNWRSPQWAKDNVTEALVNVYDWLCLPMPLAMRLYNNGVVDLSRFPCHQLNGSFNALSALRKTVQWANQRVFEENENDTPIAFVAFRRTKATAMRRWVAGGPGGNARVKLANYFNRQFTDHISTFEGDDNGLDNWRWRMEPLSHATAGIVRVPMTDPMCLRTPRLLLTLNETMEWGMHATNAGESLLEWRLMGHTMVPLCQSIGAGLEHDCSTWDEIYEDGGNDAPNAWNASKAKANDQAVGTALAQTANALEPGSEIVLRKNAKGTVK